MIPGCEAARTALSLDRSLGKHFCELGFHSPCTELGRRLEAAAALYRAPQSESEPRWTERTLLQLVSAVDAHSRHYIVLLSALVASASLSSEKDL